MNDHFSLKSKWILVTGGTRGIGRAISLHFTRAGANVIANYVRDVRAAEAFKSEAAVEGCVIHLCRADLTTQKGLDTVLAQVDACGSKLSGLVYCAATGIHRPFEQLETRHFDFTYALNVRAFFELVRRTLPRFEQNASIVAISSEGAAHYVPHYSLTGSSKGALEALVRQLAVELAPRGIRVNALSAGAVMTESWRVMPDADERLQSKVRRSPLGRLTSAEEVASAAHFLCSEAASGVLGHTLVVDVGTRIAG